MAGNADIWFIGETGFLKRPDYDAAYLLWEFRAFFHGEKRGGKSGDTRYRASRQRETI